MEIIQTAGVELDLCRALAEHSCSKFLIRGMCVETENRLGLA